ncbi:MAG: GntR family transcriptional regulator [Pseudomonadota bacterium]
MKGDTKDRPRTALKGARLKGVASVRKSAYTAFQDALMSGSISPGQLVSQRELVGLLGVSLGALRELLPRLESEGLLEVIPQRGIQVTAVDMRMIRDAYQMRMAIEREAVISAVENVAGAGINEQLALHRDILARARAENTAETLHRAQEIDAGMHEFLINATGNTQLIRTYEVIAVRVRLIYIDRMRLTPETLPDALGDHVELLEAIGQRDRPAAVAAIERHITAARSRAVSF